MEKRIYVVIAHTVDVPTGIVDQVPGRMAAQGGHAVGRMRLHMMLTAACTNKSLRTPEFRELLTNFADEKITTIWKSCRDSRELMHVQQLLFHAPIRFYEFQDENDPLYGVGVHPATALATYPATADDVEGILDYLPLWKPEED